MAIFKSPSRCCFAYGHDLTLPRSRMEAPMRKIVAMLIFALVTAPAYGQRIPPINLLQDNTPDANTRQRQKDIENEYNATMKKIPDKKKPPADPWQNLRGSGAEGKQQAPSGR
jgi:hypothetical protein